MANIEPTEKERTTIIEEPAPSIEPRRPAGGEHEAMRVVAGGSTAEALAGLAAVVLAVLGLGGVLPRYMIAIATILLGVAFLSQGATAASRFERLTAGGRQAELGGGTSAELAGGAAGVVLGVLALIGISPIVLGAIAVLVFGGTLLVSSGVTSGLGSAAQAAGYDRASHLSREAARAAAGTQVLVGLGAVALGILALIGINPVVLTLVGLLGLGAATMLGGAAVGTRLMTAMRR